MPVSNQFLDMRTRQTSNIRGLVAFCYPHQMETIQPDLPGLGLFIARETLRTRIRETITCRGYQLEPITRELLAAEILHTVDELVGHGW